MYVKHLIFLRALDVMIMQFLISWINFHLLKDYPSIAVSELVSIKSTFNK